MERGLLREGEGQQRRGPVIGVKVRRASPCAVPRFTSVSEVSQPPADAICAIEPAKVSPAAIALACSTVKGSPARVRLPACVTPALAAT